MTTIDTLPDVLANFERDLIERGFSTPEVTVTFASDRLSAYLCGGDYSNDSRFNKYVFAESLSDLLPKIRATSAELGTVTDIKLSQLREKVADAKEAAERLGLDIPELQDSIINPLTQMMKSLSENIITDQRATSAAE